MAADPRSAMEQRWDPLARLAVKLLVLNVLCLTLNLALHGPGLGFWSNGRSGATARTRERDAVGRVRAGYGRASPAPAARRLAAVTRLALRPLHAGAPRHPGTPRLRFGPPLR